VGETQEMTRMPDSLWIIKSPSTLKAVRNTICYSWS
jgi:hypothetical protein